MTQNQFRYESAVDRQIREAQERGAFDDLPGAGKPLPGPDEPDDELWWVRRYVEREGLPRELLLPPPIQLRKKIDRLPDTLRGLPTEQDVRDAVREVNLRVVEYLRAPTGPRVQVGPVDADHAVRRWRVERAADARPPEPRPAPTPAPANPWWSRLRRRRA